MSKLYAYSDVSNSERCGLCRFMRPGRNGWYECHLNEPQVSVKKECDDEAINPFAIWPSVETSDWCGQFASKKKGA